MALPSAIAAMAEHRRWVGWRWVTMPDGKRDKPPFRGDFPEFHASTTKPNSWVPFSTAAATCEAGKLDGVGYVCADDADRVYWDLDKCRNPITGEIDDWASAYVEECDTYTEITPSGAGLRIIGTHGGALRAPIHAAYRLPNGGTGEIFFRAVRFITVTGNRLPGTPDRLSDIAGPVLDLLAVAGKAQAASPLPDFGETRSREEALAPIEDVRAALKAIPNNDLHYDDWVRVGLAAFSATSGTGEGFEAWQAWSSKSGKHHDADCLRVWQSIRRSPPKRIGFGSLCYMARSANPMFVAPSWVKSAPEEAPQDGENWWSDSEAKSDTSPGPDVFRTYDIDEIIAMPPPEWLIKDIITTDGLGGFYGPPGSLKSFLALGAALCIAYGLPWMGRPVKQTGVLYVAAEGVRGLGRRIRAWQKHNKMEGVNVPFRLLAASVNLTDPVQTAKLIRTAMAAAEAEGCKIGLVIIDTVARAMAGADENSAQDMGRFISGCEAVKQEIGCAVLGIHHSGKDEERGARGSSAYLGAMDTLARVKRGDDKDTVTLTIEKQKEDEEGPPIVLGVIKIELSVGLSPESSLVLVAKATAEVDAAKEADARKQRLDLLAECARALGPDGVLTLNRLADAIGRPGGRARDAIKDAIPLAPDCAEVPTPDGIARLWRARQGEGATTPFTVRRKDM